MYVSKWPSLKTANSCAHTYAQPQTKASCLGHQLALPPPKIPTLAPRSMQPHPTEMAAGDDRSVTKLLAIVMSTDSSTSFGTSAWDACARNVSTRVTSAGPTYAARTDSKEGGKGGGKMGEEVERVGRRERGRGEMRGGYSVFDCLCACHKPGSGQWA